MNSSLAVGLTGPAELIPLIIFGLYGGVLADALDRKKLIFIGEAFALLLSVVLLINSQVANPSLWLRYSRRCLFGGKWNYQPAPLPMAKNPVRSDLRKSLVLSIGNRCRSIYKLMHDNPVGI